VPSARSSSKSLSHRGLIDRLETRLLLSAGDLNTGFGSGGTTTFNTDLSMRLRDAAVQSDGSIIVLFSSSSASAVARFSPSGVLDSGFGGGLITGAGLGGGSVYSAIAVQSDDKIVLAGDTTSGAVAVSRLLAGGGLDTDFGTNGTRLVTDNTRSFKSTAVLVRDDDRIVVGGDADAPSAFDSDFALFGLTASGNVDNAFNGGSPVTTDIGQNDFIDSLALLSDGRIVAAGRAFDGLNETPALALALYTGAGAPDSNFDQDGVLVTGQLSAEAGRTIAVQNGTQILLLDPVHSGEHIALARINANGVFDASFGDGDGIAPPINSGPIGTAFDGGMVVDPAGQVVVAYDLASTGTDIARVVRLNPDGSPDLSFVQSHNLSSGAFSGLTDRVLFRPDNSIVVATSTAAADVLLASYDGTHPPTPSVEGAATANTSLNLISVRLTYTGDVPIDPATVAANNVRLTGPGGYSELATATSDVQASGNSLSVTYRFPPPGGTLTATDEGTYQVLITGAGVQDVNDNVVQPQLVETINITVATGLADLAFANTTFAAGRYFPGDTIPANLVPASSGVATGTVAMNVVLSVDDVAGNADDIPLLSLTAATAGTPITSLGPIPSDAPPGQYRLIARLDPGNTVGELDEANNTLISTAGAVVVKAPSTSSPSLSIGGLDPGFGVSGVIRPGLGLSSTVGALQQSNGLLLIAGSQGEPGDRNIAMARRNTSNVPDDEFGGGGGVVVLDLRGSDDRVTDSALLPDGRILLVGSTSELDDDGNTIGSDFFIARFNPDGSTDDAFGDGEPVIIDFAADADGDPSVDTARELLIGPDGKLLIVGRTDAGGDTDFAFARLNGDGTLDTSFGTGGRLVTDFHGADDGALSATIAADGGIYAVGFATIGGARQAGVAKYTSAGTLDASFGTGGLVTFSAGGSDERGNAIAVSPKGKVVVAGYTATGSIGNGTYDSRFLVVRMSSNGKLDRKFGNGGVATLDVGDPATATYVEVLADERVVASGVSSPLIAQGQSGQTDIVIARFSDRGTPDTSLGGSGFVVIPTGANDADSEAEGEAKGGANFLLDLSAEETLAEFQDTTEGKLNGRQGGGAFAAGTSGDQTVIAAVVTSGVELSGELLGALPTSVIGGTKQKVLVNVLNVGDLPAEGALDITLYTSADQTLGSGDREIFTLAGKPVKLKPLTFGGRAKRFNLKFTYPVDIADGAYFLLAEVNPAQSIQELNPNNNSAFSNQPVQIAAPFVDMTGAGVTGTPLTIGKAASLPVTITNAGNIKLKTTSGITLVLSQDQTLDDGDTQVTATPARVNLNPQASKPLKLRLTPPAVAPGDYFLFVIIDSANAVAERNEANNLLASAVATPLQ